jgi:tight adherence protein C
VTVAVAVGLAWAVATAVAVGERRTPARLPVPPDQARADADGIASPGGLALSEDDQHLPRRRTPVGLLGASLRRASRRPPDREADRRVGWAALVALALLALAPALAPVPLAWAAVSPALARRRLSRAHDAAVGDQLPDVVELLALTTAAGLPIAAAVCAIGRRPGGPLGGVLGRAAAHVERGGTAAEALDLVVESAGAKVRPLADALAAHDRYGTPLVPALERLAVEARLRRRRQAEEEARRLPVVLLFPLVLTTLPAFALLTVVPLLAGSFGSLSL